MRNMLTGRGGLAAICLCALASMSLAGCAVDEDLDGGEELEEIEGAELPDEQAPELASVPACDPGWHGHVTTWPRTGMYYVGWCGEAQKLFSVPAGTGVCMENGPAHPCGGQGYARVYYAPLAQYFWARMEAFNGH